MYRGGGGGAGTYKTGSTPLSGTNSYTVTVGGGGGSLLNGLGAPDSARNGNSSFALVR